MAEALRLAVVMLTPVMPEISDKIRGLVGAESFDHLEGQLEWGSKLEGSCSWRKAILFPRPERK